MKNKPLIIGLALIVTALLAWLVWPKKSIETLQGVKSDLGLNGTSFPLKVGSMGLEVLNFQGWLNLYQGEALSLDGIWGPKTEKAARAAKYEVEIVTKYGVEIFKSTYDLEVTPKLDKIKSYIENEA